MQNCILFPSQSMFLQQYVCSGVYVSLSGQTFSYMYSRYIKVLYCKKHHCGSGPVGSEPFCRIHSESDCRSDPTVVVKLCNSSCPICYKFQKKSIKSLRRLAAILLDTLEIVNFWLGLVLGQDQGQDQHQIVSRIRVGTKMLSIYYTSIQCSIQA